MLPRLKQIVQGNRLCGHSIEALLEFLPDVFWPGNNDFRNRTVMADQLNDKRSAQIVADALIREQVADIEKIARMLPVQRRHDLPCIQVGK